jgi:probable DNA metabolism protein
MFLLLDDNGNCFAQGDLFDLDAESLSLLRKYKPEDIVLASAICSDYFDPCLLRGQARRFYDSSIEGFYSFVHAWLSEEPIDNQLLSFARAVIRDPKAAFDRGREDTRAVLEAEGRVTIDIHRMQGLLRFSPDSRGFYTARCEPDHFVLPALADYFTARFADSTAWAIIDEKRRLVLSREPGAFARIHGLDGSPESTGNGEKDPWEELWRHYHKTINNESRDNPGLQRQFMPKRYWKYLPEMTND